MRERKKKKETKAGRSGNGGVKEDHYQGGGVEERMEEWTNEWASLGSQPGNLEGFRRVCNVDRGESETFLNDGEGEKG